MRVHDTVVVGGGPGGLFAAARLAECGCDVAVVEEHAEVGRPVHCTGIVAREAFREFSLSPDSILNPLSQVRFHSPSGLEVDYDPSAVDAVVVDRAVFDRALLARATAAGVTFISGARVTRVQITPEAAVVEIEERASAVEARTVILACGASYGLQRQLGLGMPSVYLASAQMELPAGRGGQVEIYFGSQTAPAGFAWVVPVQRGEGHYVRVGLMCDGDAGYYFGRLVARVAASWGIETLEGQQPRRRLLPLAAIRRTYADRVLAIGDAAGLVKPTTGGGIYYSLLSAGLAADTLVEALRTGELGAARLAGYEAGWRERLTGEFRSQLALRMLAQRLSDTEVDGLFTLARTDGIMPLVYRTAQFNKHRDLIAALFRHEEARKLLFRRLLS